MIKIENRLFAHVCFVHHSKRDAGPSKIYTISQFNLEKGKIESDYFLNFTDYIPYFHTMCRWEKNRKKLPRLKLSSRFDGFVVIECVIN